MTVTQAAPATEVALDATRFVPDLQLAGIEPDNGVRGLPVDGAVSAPR